MHDMPGCVACKLLPYKQLLTWCMLPCSFGSMVQQVKQWITERFQGGWSRVPTQDPYAPTALGDPLIPESSSSSSPPTGSQRTGVLWFHLTSSLDALSCAFHSAVSHVGCLVYSSSNMGCFSQNTATIAYCYLTLCGQNAMSCYAALLPIAQPLIGFCSYWA